MNNYRYNKYSYICQKVIDDNTDIINKFISTNYFTNILSNNKFVQNIQKSITDTLNIKRGYNMTFHQVYKIHDMEQVPLIYILFSKLHEHGILEKLHSDIPTDFTTHNFIVWFRKSQDKINFDKILDELDKLKKEDEEVLEICSLIFNTKGPREKLHKLLYENPFVSIDVQNHAETSNMRNDNYVFDDGTQLSVYYIDSKHSLDLDLVQHILSFMENISSKLFDTGITAKPNLTIFLGLQKKFMEINNENYGESNFLAPDNINSGSTIKGHSIMLWRKEEIYKVLIHELIHFYGIDFYVYDKNYSTVEKYLDNNFCIHGFDRPNESYTETLAILFHTMFVSKYVGENLDILLWKEFVHSLIQVGKILDFYKLKSITDVQKLDSQCKSTLHQKTSVFSYYIIKSSFLLNLQNFLIFVSDKIPIKNHTDDFVKLIDSSIDNKTFHTIIDKVKNNIVLNEEYLQKNMRMSCLQIEHKQDN